MKEYRFKSAVSDLSTTMAGRAVCQMPEEWKLTAVNKFRDT